MPYVIERIERGARRTAVRRHRHGEGIEDQIALFYAVSRRALYNFFGNRDATLCRGGYAALVERQRDHSAAVFFYEWKDGVHDLVFAADRIDERLAVVNAHGALHGGGVGSVYLQGQVSDRLNFTYAAGEHGGLVDFGHTDIYIEDMRAPFALRHGFAQDIIHVARAQRLF